MTLDRRSISLQDGCQRDTCALPLASPNPGHLRGPGVLACPCEAPMVRSRGLRSHPGGVVPTPGSSCLTGGALLPGGRVVPTQGWPAHGPAEQGGAAVATSRTGTTKWKRLAADVRRRALHNGMTTCPLCGVELNFTVGRTPTSAEVDHVVPHSRGGRDEVSNLRVLCRRCNQSRGNGLKRPRVRSGNAATVITETASSDEW